MSHAVHLVCPHCQSVNRVPQERLGDRAVCGQCREPLFAGKPVAVDGNAFTKHLSRDGIPVLVDFWAPWCGPCKTFAPTFEQAAARLEPRVRLLKLDTEQAPQAAAGHGIRSIPTLAIFKGGRELGRQSGVMDLGSLTRWVEQTVSG